MKDVEYFRFNINEISRRDINAAYFVMSPERREKCDRYLRESDKRICIAADMLLRNALSERTGYAPEDLVFNIGKYGKPYLVNTDYNFNVSHSGDYIAIVLNKNKAVGIDIEKIRPVKFRLLSHFCTDSDMDFIFERNKDFFSDELIENEDILTRVFRVWTYKEAYVKSIGERIVEYAKKISFDENNCCESHFLDYRACIVIQK